jgi:hypothetical protein|tara:strand:- start:125 stop:733 length:609 start_codon:yes stop_codon:yes gene_type:complete
MRKMKVLVACEFSGVVRDAFAAKGHTAISCDLLEGEGNHYQGNVLDILDQDWDLMIAFPPCTYLCSSGLHWNKGNPVRDIKTSLAIDFVLALMDAPIEHIAVENPVGCLSTRVRKPDQIIQPYNFGEDASKRTCFWLTNLKLLKPTLYVPGRVVNGKERWANQTDSGQNKLSPSVDRWKKRSITYQGVADAMADQWSEPNAR